MRMELTVVFDSGDSDKERTIEIDAAGDISIHGGRNLTRRQVEILNKLSDIVTTDGVSDS